MSDFVDEDLEATSYTSGFGRKFWLAVGVVVSATLLVWFGKIADGVYSAVIIATVTAYIVGNVSQKVLVKDTSQ